MSNEWKDAVLDALTICWALRAEHRHDPRKAVADLVTTEISQALDPSISQAAQMMINERDAQWRDAVVADAPKDVADKILLDMGVVES